MTFLDDYNRGYEVLSISAEVFARLSQSIGQPMPNKEISTACVSYSPETKVIHFEMNPDYIAGLSDEEIGAVISHETFHILLDHLSDLPDRKKYPNLKALIHAQECIINDALFGNVGLNLPKGVLSGVEIYQQDFSMFSTKEGYEFIVGDEESSQGDSSNSESSNSSENSESSSNSDEANSQKDEDSKEDHSGGGSKTESQDDSDATEDGDSSSGSSDADSDSDESGDGENSSVSSSSNSDSEENEPSDGHMCGGIRVRDEDMQDFKDAVSDAINSAMSNFNPSEVPSNVTDAIEKLSHEDGMSINSSGWSIGSVDNTTEFLASPAADLDLNWADLLARINPKIKSTGRPKQRESWHAPRRKMIGSYPEIILPTYRRKDDPENKGDSVPLFILALDMSYSIPEYLIKKLASLADSIPKDIIKPHPITWSSDIRFFDTSTRRIVKRSGTNIDKVYEYAEQLEKETKTKPYVLVITDGDCNFGYHDSSLPSRMDHKKVHDRWFWMATEPKHVKLIKRNFGSYSPNENIYSIADFM